MPRKKRKMRERRFWFDINKPHENYMYEATKELIDGRSWSSFIKDAISLLWDLSHGGRDELDRLFPGLKVNGIKVDPRARLAQPDLEANALIWEQIETGRDNGFTIISTVEELEGYE